MKRKLLITVAAFAAIVSFVFLFAHVNRPATVRAYFRLEGLWVDHWPFERGRWAGQDLAPFLARIGILGPVRREVEPGVSFLLDPRDLVPVTILRTGEWQPEVWESLSPALSRGHVFLDVGAHIGYFSIKAAVRVGSTGRVVAFEPNPETLKQLRDNIAASKAPNIIVEPIACTDREQTLTFYAAPIVNTGASSLSKKNANQSISEAPKPYQVRGRLIDDVVRELKLDRVDAMKVDVEGAEVSVLRGAADTLKRFHPVIAVEMIPEQLASFQTTPADLITILKDAGYNRSRPLNRDQADWEWSYQDPHALRSSISMAEPSAPAHLLSGFYDVEGNSWRWTADKFTVALRPPPQSQIRGAWLSLRFNLPEQSVQKFKTVTLSAAIGGLKLAPQTFTAAGPHEYRRQVPASALRGRDEINIDFALDHYLTHTADNRDLGVVVQFVGLE